MNPSEITCLHFVYEFLRRTRKLDILKHVMAIDVQINSGLVRASVCLRCVNLAKSKVIPIYPYPLTNTFNIDESELEHRLAWAIVDTIIKEI